MFFSIWEQGSKAFDELLNNYLNNCHITIKFQAEVSDTISPFLDTIVTIKNNCIHTHVHTEPNDKKQYHTQNAFDIATIQTETRHSVKTWLFSNSNYSAVVINPNSVIDDKFAKIWTVNQDSSLKYKDQTQTRLNFQNRRLGYKSLLPLIITFFDHQFDYKTLNKNLK